MFECHARSERNPALYQLVDLKSEQSCNSALNCFWVWWICTDLLTGSGLRHCSLVLLKAGSAPVDYLKQVIEQPSADVTELRVGIGW